ncbi:MAG: amidohydrolase [Halobacteria archaeon]|nr:amidohydrolase [Halobacteria archaeon]
MRNSKGLLLHNADVYVFDDKRSEAESILFRNGYVEAVGTNRDVMEHAKDPMKIDLDGRVVIPGFNDAHTHIIGVGNQLLETNLSKAKSRDEALSMLSENAEDTDTGEWVIGFGYDESTWPRGEREYLTKEELDRVSDEHPVVAQRVDGHTLSLNTKGLDKVDFNGAEHDIEEVDDELTGVVVEDAAARVKRAMYPGPEKSKKALRKAIERAHELGVTSVQTMSGVVTLEGRGNPDHKAYFSLWREDELDLRITFYVHQDHVESLADLEVASCFGDSRLKIGGVKFFSDGSVGAHTAKIYGEYTDDPGNDGQMVNDGESLEEMFEITAEANQQMATHAIGDKAIDTVLEGYESVLDEYETEPRLRVEHFEFATDEALERAAENRIIASMQPNFLQWSYNDGLYETRLGEKSLSKNNRYRDVLDAGIPLAFGSDAMPFGPLYGIHHAVNAPHESQRVSVDEAIAAYTRNAAYAEFAEDEKGTLEPGMLGDAVVLDRDPFEHPDEIKDIEVVMTIFEGDIVYSKF